MNAHDDAARGTPNTSAAAGPARSLRSGALHGVIVPLVTPLKPDERPDLDAIGPVVNHVIEGGVHSIFSLGTTGEFARLDRADRYRVAEATVRAARGRLPVLVGASDTGTRRVVENAKRAESIGADAIVASLPFYFPAADDREVVAFYREVAGATSLPLILYNIPATSGAAISLNAFRTLLDDPRIVAIKDSSGSLEVLRELVAAARARRGFAVFVGEERICLEGLREGAVGIVPSLANPFPRLFARLVSAFESGDEARAGELAATIRDMNAINLYSGSWLSAVAWRKAALAEMKICGDTMTAPSVPIDSATRERVSRAVARYRAE